MAKQKSTKRADGRLVKTFIDENTGKRIYVYGYSEKELAKNVEAKKAELRNGLLGDNPTLGEYFDNHLENRLRNNLIKPSTAHIQECQFNENIRPVIGNFKIKKITTAHCEKVQAELLKPNEKGKAKSDSYIKSVMKLLFATLESARKKRIIPYNPAESVEKIQIDEATEQAKQTVHRPLTDSEIKAFFEKASDSDYLNMYKILLATGMRAGEACALKRSDIDFSSKTLTVKRTQVMERTGGSYTVSIPKSRKFRTIPLSDLAIEALKNQIALRTELFGSADAFQDNYLFFSPKGGDMALRNSVLKDCKRICKEAGIEDIGTHSFRATFTNNALRAGVKIETVAEILGHSSIEITFKYYVSVNSETKANAVEKAVVDLAI